ncbi:retrovirus-related pol polyprotein from transposon TNT 1-94 [Tanacetum coccineum]
MAAAGDIDKVEETEQLSYAKQITALNEEISNLNNQLSKEKSILSLLQEKKKKLKSDFKTREDELLDKQIQYEKKIKELDNILVKTGQSIQTMRMLSPKPKLFYHTEQKMALGYQNAFYLKQAQQKQQSLYNGRVLLEKHDPPAAKSREEVYFSNTSKTASVSKTVSKPISIPDDEFLDDTPSVARKFLNEVKDTIVTLQSVIKHRLNANITNWSSPAYQEFQKIIKDEIAPIVNQVDTRVKNFENHFVKEAAKLVREFKSLAKQANESLDKITVLEKGNERFLRAVVSQDIISIVQNTTVVETSDIQTELEPYNNMQHQIERLQAQLGDLKGKSMDTQCASDTLDPLSHKLEDENVELEFQVLNYAKENTHRVDNIARRPQPRNNTKNDRISSASKSSCIKNKEVEVEEHHRNLLLSKNQKHKSSECNNIKLVIRNDKFEVVCAMCKQCLITSNHDVCKLNYVNDMNSRVDNQNANVSNAANQKKHKPKVKKTKKVRSKEKLALPKPRKPRTCLRWSPSGRFFDLNRKLIISSDSECLSDSSKGDNACTSNPKEPTSKQFPNSTFSLAGCPNLFMFLGTVCFGNDHIAAILGYGDLQWGNILITSVYFVESLRHNLFSIGQFCDSDLEVSFKRNTCFVRNLEGVDLLKGNRTTNLYTTKLHEMASTSPICLMSRATSTKSWLWHQHLSHLNFDTINDLTKNDLVTGLSKFKYHKEYVCPSCEQGKSKKASHPPKPVSNSKQRLHLFHMDLCGPMRVKSINRKRYILVIVDDYSRYTWVHFLRSKDEAPEEIKTFLKKIQLLLQALVIIVRIDNNTKFKNQVFKEYFDDVGISHQTALCYSKNDHEDIWNLGAKGVIGFFIGYSANSCAYRVYNRRTRKIIETMNVTFDELSVMAFEQDSSKPGLQGLTSGQISSRLDLTYAPSTITSQKPTERESDLLFEAMYDDYIGGQPSAAPRTSPATPAPQDVDELSQQHWTKDHFLEQVIGEPSRPVLTRNQLRTDGEMCTYALTVSTMEPRNVKEAMTDPAWIDSMQEELLQFKRLDVWVLVPAPDNIKPLTLKWLLKNKHDEEKRMEAISIILAYTTHKSFIVFQKDVKTAFLHGSLKEDVYVCQPEEILKKHGMETCDPIGTPMEITDKLDLDKNGTLVDATKYQSMISALMYLTSRRPDIVHATCLCARYQAQPTEKHLKEVKRIFHYLRGTVNMGVWYTKDSGFELTRFSDADYARCRDSFKSTSGGT